MQSYSSKFWFLAVLWACFSAPRFVSTEISWAQLNVPYGGTNDFRMSELSLYQRDADITYNKDFDT